jgi:hypothetical protein
MQMYKVSFRAKRGDVVDIGTYLICAGSIELAEQGVAAHLEIPASGTTFETSRVKPSIYELKRSEFTAKTSAGGSDNAEPGAVHEVRASAKVFGYSESSVIRRFASAITENSSAVKSALPKHINELSVEIERADERPRQSRIDEQSIFKESRGLTHHVLIEADNAGEATERALRMGIYFDGVNSGMDCECCGDRWYEPWRDAGSEHPEVYGRNVREPSEDGDSSIAWMDKGKEICLHPKSGPLEWFPA